MNTTTAHRRNALLAQHNIRLPAGITGGILRPCPDTPRHDFLVLNQRPDLTSEDFLRLAPSAAQKT